jgi:hypothetical protein
MTDFRSRFLRLPIHSQILSVFAGILVLMAVAMASWWHYSGAVYGIQDPDVWVRLVRVWQWHDGAGWYDRMLPRLNAPDGLENHWTRPLDVWLAVLAWPVSFFMPYRDALLFAAVTYNALLGLLSISGLLTIGRVLGFGPAGQWAGALVFLTDSLIRAPYMVGRADHHSLVFTCLIWMLACIAYSRMAWAGVLAGLALWIAPEFLVAIALAAAVPCAFWALSGATVQLRAVLRFLLAALGVSLLAVALEWPPSAWFTVTHIRISVVHVHILAVALAATVLLRMAARHVSSTGRRLAVAAILGACALAWLGFMYPRFWEGPMADTPPELVAAFSQQMELRPIFVLFNTFGGMGITAVLLIGVVSYLVFLRRNPSHLFVWTMLAMATAYGVLMLTMSRWSAYAMIVCVPAWSLVAENIAAWAEKNRASFKSQAKHTPILVAILLLVVLRDLLYFPSALDAKPQTLGEQKCWPKLVKMLEEDTLSSVAASPSDIVLTHMDVVGQAIFWTPHRVLASNYANYNADGIRDLDAFLFAQDAAQALEIVRKRRVGLVLLCMDAVTAPFFAPGSGVEPLFLRSVAEGHTPTWIAPVQGDYPKDMLFLRVRLPHE